MLFRSQQDSALFLYDLCKMISIVFFVDSLSNPLFIVTICVPKRRAKMICADYQVFMFCVPKVDGVENEEGRWKHSSKSKAACQVKLLLLPICVPSHNFFRNFLAKNFVDSIIFVTFAGEFERTEKNGRDEDSN